MPRVFGGSLSPARNQRPARAVFASLGVHLMGAAVLVQWPVPKPAALEEQKAKPIFLPRASIRSPSQETKPPAAGNHGPARITQNVNPVVRRHNSVPDPDNVAPLTPETPGPEPAESCLRDCDPAGDASPGDADRGGQGGGGGGQGPAVGPGAGPVPLGGLITPPVKIVDVKPIYPELALRINAQGVVLLQCLIGKDGKVSDVEVLSGHPLLRAAAVDAVRRWVYRPTQLNHIPVEVVMTVTVFFRRP